jgi:hypothetical protein
MSASAYVRTLILRDLLDKGVITDRIITLVTIGRTA